MRKMKRVEDSRTENTYLIMNKHINSYGRLFGGVLMQWIDEMAGIVAHRHAGTIVTTACVDKRHCNCCKSGADSWIIFCVSVYSCADIHG